MTSVGDKFSHFVDVEARRIYLVDDIESESAGRFIIGLHHLDSSDGDITVIINSGGGVETDGYAIYDAIRLCRNKIVMVGYGTVSSIAAAIFQAGDVRLMTPSSEFMIHHGDIGAEERMKQDEVANLVERVERGKGKYFRVLTERSGQPPETIDDWCREERCFSPEEAIEVGFADAILRPVPDGAVAIPLGELGHFAFIDEKDVDRVSPYSWNVGNGRYAQSGSFVDENGNQKWVKMHRFIVDAGDNEVVDHINGDTFDNRSSNLRKCSAEGNAKNRKKQKSPTSSKFKGVHKVRSGWAARIQVNGKRMALGVFADEIEAAKAYDDAAQQYHGSFAKFNLKGNK